ncbi:TRAP transporter large permease [Nitratireductor sp. L1-7-SE]|uniref:TRAP transporter large permease protein n=1 Tax=Nitratireductor rhodophyticola TaxID=2854036 RepID=A0ABS7R9K9_9HYPH|nr:TRAP transporter large permease [Nitratireductor rhodophyticola]MBY8917334.1 TRAP transporter large permease [Nitratireductor rhodophyticola]MBY8920237.1 TRAP transporter large permease [Nitratireductor rhodophyticola]MEC9244903.1 TRAP transporter large permease [Pseudomonadota bacterium]
MGLTILFVSLFVLMLLRVPIAFSLALSSFAYILHSGLPPVVLMHNMVNGMDSFPLLAIPFFIFAGALMNSAGITARIFGFARAIVGWMHGGLGHVNIGASIIFAGMSGAAVADAGGLGAIEIKAMREAGYDDDFSVGVTAASSTIGPIIPPSLPLVIFGVMASVSIGQLFVAGIVPGLLMAVSLSAMVWWKSRRRNYPRDVAFRLDTIASRFKAAFLPLMTPVIIVGGIVSGAFTPTEAAIAAAAYALFLGIIVYRTLTPRKLAVISLETIETTAAIMMIVGAASVFAWILTANQVATHFAEFVLSFTDSRAMVLLLIMVVVLIVGLFMETIAAISILVPVLMPVAAQFGIDPVHLGIIVILNLMLGLLTPPVGMVLFVLSRVSRVPFEQCVRATLPFLVPLLAVLLLLTFIPQLVLWLPQLLYGG